MLNYSATNNIKDLRTKRSTSKQLLWFFMSVCLISWMFWVLGFSEVFKATFPFFDELILHLGNFTPSIAAIIFIVASGREGLSIFIKKVLKFKYALKWYALTVFLMPAVLIIAYLLSFLAARLQFNSILSPIILPGIWPLIPLLAYFIVMQGPLGEELGWRGYALPRLLSLFNPLKSSLILGLVWSIWHFPKFFFEGSIQHTIADAHGIFIALLGYTFYTIMLTIIITLLFIKTHGSVWSAILFHAMANFSHGLITILEQTSGGIAILLVMFIVSCFFVFRFRDDYLFNNKVSNNFGLEI